ncbi:MAG: TfoX/Sxy family protein [Clostridia bacterium]|nr:TfoX/Sxy family protein [Clostridia bacterium]
MASSKEYLEYVSDLLSGIDGIRTRPMMGEYLIYYNDKVVGGIYDDRFLLKPTEGVLKVINSPSYEIPYDGAKPMILIDTEDRELLQSAIKAAYADIMKK